MGAMSNVDRALSALREMIFSGQLAPGSDHLETELAEQLGMSRTPVREAALMLQAQGLVDVRPRRGIRVRPVEPEGFDDVARSLAEGARVANHGPEVGLCDAIITRMPGTLTFPILQRLCGPGLVVSDAETKAAMRAAYDRLRIVVEPGGAVALAAALYHGSEIDAPAVIATVSGGNVDPALFAAVLAGA